VRLKAEGALEEDCQHRPVQYLNNGVLPTKVRKTPHDLPQTNEIRPFAAPKIKPPKGLPFWGLDSERILELFARELHLPSRLICRQGQPSHLREPRIVSSRSFAARGPVQSCSGAEDAIDNVRGPTPYASCVNGIVSVVMIHGVLRTFVGISPRVGWSRGGRPVSCAKEGVVFENTSAVEDLVVLRYFGPDANPEAPEVGRVV
jgi:hypothetical protein